jgi:hypothetical protein
MLSKISINIFQLGFQEHLFEINIEPRLNYSEIEEILFILHFQELHNKATEHINQFLPMVRATATLEDLRHFIAEILNRYTAMNYDSWHRDLVYFENPTIEELLTHPNEKVREYAKRISWRKINNIARGRDR